MGRRTEGDEELAAIGVRSRVRHGEHADAIVAQVGMKLVLERVARTAVALAQRVAPLDDKAVDDAMKGDAVIVRLLVALLGLRMRPLLGAFRQADEVRHGLRRFLVEEFHGEVAERRLEVRVSGHGEYCRRKGSYLMMSRSCLTRSASAGSSAATSRSGRALITSPPLA